MIMYCIQNLSIPSVFYLLKFQSITVFVKFIHSQLIPVGCSFQLTCKRCSVRQVTMSVDVIHGIILILKKTARLFVHVCILRFNQHYRLCNSMLLYPTEVCNSLGFQTIRSVLIMHILSLIHI